MIRPLHALISLALVTALAPAAMAAERPIWTPEASVVPPRDAAPPSPAFRGRHASVARNTHTSPLTARKTDRLDLVASMVDGYLQDGWESAVAVSATDASNVVVAYHEGWDFDPDIPLANCRTGVPSWVTTTFPTGTGIFTGFPSQPWAVAGNQPGEFITSMVREDTYPTDNTHTLLARSTDNGATFTRRYEVLRDAKQDRPMFDIDRPASRGGTTGPWDGDLWLTFDDYGPAGSGYVGSWFQVLDGDSVTTDVQVSGTGTVPFRGSQWQPVSGLNDGQVFLVSNSIANGGATVLATFHEFLNGGATRSYSKSTIAWSPAGQKLGGSTHWGVNGHRIDEHGALALDRSFGPRRGYLYFVTNRNPNPLDATQDQGDLWLSVSVTRGSNWTSAPIPTQVGKTQFFPMLDVDSQGWLHLAYYQNESGYTDGGVLNAGRVNVYYTVSRDGGQSWAPIVRVNEADHGLNMEEPPLQLASYDYDLIGDYMQIRAAGTGDQTFAYVAWTGYDQYRSDDALGEKKQRVYTTRVGAAAVPATTPPATAALALAMAAAAAATMAWRARRRA